MARKFNCGLETNDFSFFSATSSSGSWATVAVNAASKRTGTYGLEVSKASGSSGSGYAEAQFNAASTVFLSMGDGATTDTAANASLATTDANGIETTGSGKGAFPINFRFYHQPVTSAGTNNLAIFVVRTGSAAKAAVTLSGSTPTYGISTGSGISALGLYAPTLTTWYRIHLYIGAPGSGASTSAGDTNLYSEVIGTIYTASGTTPLAQGRISVALGASQAIDRFRIGAIPTTQASGAEKHYFDDIAVNNGSNLGNYTGIHTGDCGAGSILAAVQPNATGTYNEWNIDTGAGGANNYQRVDEWPANTGGARDYVTTVVGASGADDLKRDTYNMADYAGANTVKSVAVLIVTADVDGSGTAGHNMGLYDNTATKYQQTSIDVTNGTSTIYRGVVCGEQTNSAGAWTNTIFNRQQPCVTRGQPAGSSLYLYDRIVDAVITETEDNDGVTIVAPTYAGDRARGQVV